MSAVVTMMVVTGCSALGAPASANGRVRVIEVGHALHEPHWSQGAVYGLVDTTRQVAKVDVAGADTSVTLSDPLGELGENLAVGENVRHVVYVPQPGSGRVAVLDADDLRERSSFDAGASPRYLALDVGSDLLLSLDADGSTVTGVRLRGFDELPGKPVHADVPSRLDASARGRPVDYFVSGAQGIAHYQGAPGEVEQDGRLPIEAHTTAGDGIKVSRVYVAESGTGRLLAVEVKREHRGLEVTATAELDQPVSHIGVDEMRVYAVTDHAVTVFETNTYEGYENDTFPMLDTIEYRAALPGRLEDATVSGVAVGDDEVYLSFETEPYLVGITKPEL